jgi:hypothetical protein
MYILQFSSRDKLYKENLTVSTLADEAIISPRKTLHPISYLQNATTTHSGTFTFNTPIKQKFKNHIKPFIIMIMKVTNKMQLYGLIYYS